MHIVHNQALFAHARLDLRAGRYPLQAVIDFEDQSLRVVS
jgi:hypothetical protein